MLTASGIGRHPAPLLPIFPKAASDASKGSSHAFGTHRSPSWVQSIFRSLQPKPTDHERPSRVPSRPSMRASDFLHWHSLIRWCRCALHQSHSSSYRQWRSEHLLSSSDSLAHCHGDPGHWNLPAHRQRVSISSHSNFAQAPVSIASP